MKGAVDVKCSQVSTNTTIKVTRQELNDGRKVLAFKVIGFELTIPHKHVQLVVHGNLEMKTAYMFKRLFFGRLKEKLEGGLANALENKLMPKVNTMITKTRGYGQFIEGMQFDTSLQQEPTMEQQSNGQAYMGLEMTGIFSPLGGPDLQPQDFEMNNTDASLPVHDNEERDDFELFLH